ncbi:MAG: glycoside hydrolase family 99-like domain-containing protein [Armatimonadota bacterium]|nr:glycoside hydrolase family 99-like domain-containing protein [bacterium]
MGRQYQVGVYYFPNYHVDSRNEAVHGKGWTEWELVKRGEPKFPGHQQPKVPLWGYEDESDPTVFAKKIDAAADHGINHFIFDWYHYENGPFLNGCLDRGYLNAPNNDRLKFCLMWANHAWQDIHPAKANQEPKLLYPGEVGPDAFDRISSMIVEKYFKHPSYWAIDGCPYFSIYDLTSLIRGLGGLEQAHQAMQAFREKVKAAGFPDLHLNAVIFGNVVLPSEEVIENHADVLSAIGFDSGTSYVWVHHGGLEHYPTTDYKVTEECYFQYCKTAGEKIGLPYYPNITMGWDSSPRTCQSDIYSNIGYPFTPMIIGNTPQAFKQALQRVKSFIDEQCSHNILNINSWNEWTEGSYIEPDAVNGMAYLEAVKEVFG